MDRYVRKYAQTDPLIRISERHGLSQPDDFIGFFFFSVFVFTTGPVFLFRQGLLSVLLFFLVFDRIGVAARRFP